LNTTTDMWVGTCLEEQLAIANWSHINHLFGRVKEEEWWCNYSSIACSKCYLPRIDVVFYVAWI